MSIHTYSICFTHFVFTTYNKEPILNKEASILISQYFKEYAKEKGIYHRINFVNPEHVHLLINLPTYLSVEKTIHLFKGSSSYWINKQNLFPDKFYWERGYGVFFVSARYVDKISFYIANQEEHHKTVSFEKEFKTLTKRLIPK